MQNIFFKNHLQFPVSVMLQNIFQRLRILSLSDWSVSFEDILDTWMLIIVKGEFNELILSIRNKITANFSRWTDQEILFFIRVIK